MSLQDHRLPMARLVTVAELLAGWAVAEHGWRPSTTAGNRSIVRTLATDPLLAIRVAALTSSVMRATVARWQAAGASVAVTSARVRAVRSALGWGYDQRVIDAHPLRFFRGPGRCPPHRPLSDEDIRRLGENGHAALVRGGDNQRA